MGSLGRAFGGLLGVKRVRVPDVTAPPKSTATAVDEVDREALASQRGRRNIAAQDDRSLLGTADSDSTTESLLQNVNKTSTKINIRDTKRQAVVKEHDEKQRLEKLRLERLRLTNGGLNPQGLVGTHLAGT